MNTLKFNSEWDANWMYDFWKRKKFIVVLYMEHRGTYVVLLDHCALQIL